MNSLKALLNPRSIAILGASTDFTKVNGRTLKFLLVAFIFGYFAFRSRVRTSSACGRS